MGKIHEKAVCGSFRLIFGDFAHWEGSYQIEETLCISLSRNMIASLTVFRKSPWYFH